MKNDRIGRSVIMSADDLKAKAIGALRRLQKLPGIVPRSCGIRSSLTSWNYTRERKRSLQSYFFLSNCETVATRHAL